MKAGDVIGHQFMGVIEEVAPRSSASGKATASWSPRSSFADDAGTASIPSTAINDVSKCTQRPLPTPNRPVDRVRI
jgi:hypothetical protein